MKLEKFVSDHYIQSLTIKLELPVLEFFKEFIVHENTQI